LHEGLRVQILVEFVFELLQVVIESEVVVETAVVPIEVQVPKFEPSSFM
jgi:hypothetical protein